jgi:hypothetical protein
MSSAATFVSARPSRVSAKRLWCQRLACGRIVAELRDGTLLLCTEKYGHLDPCLHSEVSPPPQTEFHFWRAA